jgi:signal transduction histidine kinase
MALLQAAILIGIFGCVAYFGHLAQQRVTRNVIEGRVLGEVASLRDEITAKGIDHLSHTVDKRSHLWRGFEYRLTAPDGTYRAGLLSASETAPGWAIVTDRSGKESRQIRTYSERLSDGGLLSVGQDISAEAEQTAILTNILLWSGALSVSLGFGVSCLFAASGWRRVSALARVAREATMGRLDVRVPISAKGLRDDIDDLGTTFNTMLAEIGILMSQVQQVSTAVAHDLRTPLTRVRQRVESLTGIVGSNPILRETVERVDAELEELSRTFDAILRLAEIEHNRHSFTEPVDLGAVVTRVAEAYRPEIEESGRLFNTSVDTRHILGDSQLISQAVANLLDNALKHTPAGTPIRLGVEGRPEGPTVFVADGGPGIPESNRRAALERFRKLDTSRPGPGCGLGLAIVAAIAKRHAAALCLFDARPGLRVELQFRATG